LIVSTHVGWDAIEKTGEIQASRTAESMPGQNKYPCPQQGKTGAEILLAEDLDGQRKAEDDCKTNDKLNLLKPGYWFSTGAPQFRNSDSRRADNVASPPRIVRAVPT
jgi:hypothetical protein